MGITGLEKRPPILFICIIVGLFALIICTFVHNIYLWPVTYKSNHSLEPGENREIKALVLNVMKDQFLEPGLVDENKLYTKEYLLGDMYSSSNGRQKHLFISIDTEFMDSVEKIGEAIYIAQVETRFPDTYYYYFTIKVVNGQYRVLNLEIDL